MDAFAGAIGVSDSDGKSTPVYSACVPRGEFYTNTRYYAYLLRYMALSGFIESLAKGIRERSTDFRFGDFSNLILPNPSEPEQDRIVDFLDHKTAEIDAAIAKKQALIQLLNEQKAILINRAVTKGLNPNVKMKDSGVAWIGEIPQHWEVSRLQFLFQEVDSRSKTGEEVLFSLRMKEGLIPHTEVSDKPVLQAQLVGYKHINPGQLVMNRMRAAIGLFDFATAHGLVSPDYAIFNQLTDVESGYLLRLLKDPNLCAEFRLKSRGLGDGTAGFMRLYTDQFGKIKIPLPPKTERQDIVDYISSLQSNADTTLASIELELAKLVELKAVLISSVTTGKIKV